jgi:hypothetical protein
MMTVCCATIFLSLVMAGCTPIERQAYNVIVSSKAFIVCATLSRAVFAQNALVDAAEVYCSGPQFEAGGACQPPQKGTPALQQATAKLQAAIASYQQIENEVKGAVK